jgi:hypothetical protein
MNIWQIDSAGIYGMNINEKISYPENLNDFCFAVEDNSDWFMFRNELIQFYVKKHLLNGDFLDIGGGNGFQVKALDDNKIIQGSVVLIEPGYHGCLNAIKRKCKHVYCGFFQDLDFNQPHKITMCGLFDVIEHIDDDVNFLNELYKKLPNYSRVFVNVPANSDYWSLTDVYAGHFRRYDDTDLERIEQKTPFKVIDSSFYFDFYILPLILFRLIPEKLGFKKNEAQIISSEKRNLTATNKSVLNKFFRYIHKLKLKKIQNGGRIKNGTSLFFVLEKRL